MIDELSIVNCDDWTSESGRDLFSSMELSSVHTPPNGFDSVEDFFRRL